MNFVYARVNEQDEFIEEVRFNGELDPADIKKFGNKLALRPLVESKEPLKAWQNYSGHTYIVHDETVEKSFQVMETITESQYKEIRKLDISNKAEKIRLKFITPGSGKALAYYQKAQEALAFENDVSPSAQKYPLVYAEVGITAETPAQVAAIIRGKHNGFKVIESQIAAIELQARKDVDDVTGHQNIDDVIGGIQWPVL